MDHELDIVNQELAIMSHEVDTEDFDYQLDMSRRVEEGDLMPSTFTSNGLWYPLDPSPEDLIAFRHIAIKALWNKYQKGEYPVTKNPIPDCHIDFIQADNLQVGLSHHAFTGELRNIDISNAGDPNYPGVNFMGFDPQKRCLAFRGEARNFASFLAFAQSLVSCEKVDTVFKAPSDVKFPVRGLQPGLDYHDFAGQVEIVEYALWLKAPADGYLDDEGEGKMIFLAVVRFEDLPRASSPTDVDREEEEQPTTAASETWDLFGEDEDLPSQATVSPLTDVEAEELVNDSETAAEELSPKESEDKKLQEKADAAYAATLAKGRYPLRKRKRSIDEDLGWLEEKSPSKPPLPESMAGPSPSTKRPKRGIAKKTKPSNRR